MKRMNTRREVVAGTINDRDGDRVMFGYLYFRTISRETLSIPTKNVDIGASTKYTTDQMLQKESLEKSDPSLFGEKAASITGIVATHIQKSLNVITM